MHTILTKHCDHIPSSVHTEVWCYIHVQLDINLWCEKHPSFCHHMVLKLTYGTNDTSISDHAGMTEHVQQGDMLDMRGSTLGLMLWHHTVARVRVGREHPATLALPLTVCKGRGHSCVNGAV